jgi:hypothetical protein
MPRSGCWSRCHRFECWGQIGMGPPAAWLDVETLEFVSSTGGRWADQWPGPNVCPSSPPRQCHPSKLPSELGLMPRVQPAFSAHARAEARYNRLMPPERHADNLADMPPWLACMCPVPDLQEDRWRNPRSTMHLKPAGGAGEQGDSVRATSSAPPARAREACWWRSRPTSAVGAKGPVTSASIKIVARPAVDQAGYTS